MRLALFFVVLTCCLAQQPAEAPRPQRQPPPPPKNLKLLKPEEVRSAMQAYRTALGVQCTFCHVQGNFASDDNRHKEVARNMITMTREINAKLGDEAAAKVTCYTCHHGAEHPATAPAAAAQDAPAPPKAADAPAPAPTTTP